MIWNVRLAATVALVMMLAAPAVAVVTANPSTITFDNQERAVLIALSHNGQRIAPDAISGSRLLVGTSDYSRMISISKTADGIRVAPTQLLEVGSYDLVVDTRHGQAHIQVFAPLADLKSILDDAGGPGGPRLGALREELGFTRSTGRATVSIELPPVYSLGETLSVTMPHDANREYIWAINGEVIQQGRGASGFQYAFPAPGDYILTYAERENGSTVARAEAITRVTEPPALAYAVPRGTSPAFEGPDGYSAYQWEVDGVVRGNHRSFSMRFDKPGEYFVTLRATADGRPPYIIRYRTMVE